MIKLSKFTFLSFNSELVAHTKRSIFSFFLYIFSIIISLTFISPAYAAAPPSYNVYSIFDINKPSTLEPKENWDLKAPSSTNFFNPKGTVTHILCFLGVCGKETITLDAFGGCSIFPMTGLFRMCLRPTAADKNGNTQYDRDSNNNPLIPLPKICLFNDPMNGFIEEFNDPDASRMPFHQNTPAPTGSSSANTSNQAGQAATGLEGAAAVTAVIGVFMGPFSGFFYVSAGLLAAAGGLAELVSFIMKTINYSVLETVQCIPIPLGPVPPPYYPKIYVSSPAAIVYNICNAEYQVGDSSKSTVSTISGGKNAITGAAEIVCEISGGPTLNYNSSPAATAVYSTFENPKIRVSFENPILQCSSSSSSSDTSPCVTFSNTQTVDSSYGTFNTNYLGLIGGCGNASSGAPCANFSNVAGLSISSDPIRVIYSYPNLENMLNTWISSDSSGGAITLNGVQYSNYVDLSATFPGGSSLSMNSSSKSVTDPLGNDRTFNLQIDSTNPDPSKICAYEGLKEIGCISRPVMPKPQVTSCGNKLNATFGGVVQTPTDAGCANSCSNLASITAGLGNPMQSTYLSYIPGQEMPVTYLHGYPYSIYMTDNYYTDPDANGNIIGNYVNASGVATKLSDNAITTLFGNSSQAGLLSGAYQVLVSSSNNSNLSSAVLSQATSYISQINKYQTRLDNKTKNYEFWYPDKVIMLQSKIADLTASLESLANSVGLTSSELTAIVNGASSSTLAPTLYDKDGNAVDLTLFVDSSGNQLTYSSGVEYSGGQYIRGATQICLTGYSGPQQVVAAVNTNNSVTTNYTSYSTSSSGSNSSYTTYYPYNSTVKRLFPLYSQTETYPLSSTYIATTYTSDSSGNQIVKNAGSSINYTGRDSSKSSYNLISGSEVLRPLNPMEYGLCVPIDSTLVNSLNCPAGTSLPY